MIVYKEGKVGFINATDRLVVPCEYDYAGYFSEGFVSVLKGEQWGFIDTAGRLVVPCEYDRVGDFRKGLAPVEKDEKCGFINTTGTLVIPCEYEYGNVEAVTCDGNILCLKNGYLYVLDATGKLLFP